MQTIQAVYENGVFRPTVPVFLPEQSIVEFEPRLHVEPSDENCVEPTLAALLKHAGALNELPPDMAAQHDHYIHGTPKR